MNPPRALPARRRLPFWRALRITLLLGLLLALLLGGWQQRQLVTAWETPLWVALHPAAGDAAAASAAHVAALTRQDFAAIERFLAREAARHGVSLAQPVTLKLAPPLADLPPLPPLDGHPLAIAAWSLRLRWWAWQLGRRDGSPPADVRLVLLYHDPEQQPRLPHSLGLERGRIGIVNLFAAARDAPRNQFVVAHELLHTLGASDKYDPASNQPRYPDGYAEPEREPLYPQPRAEVMGGRIPFGPATAV
ncbi:MAG TPA: hypothetical protein VIW02_08785, partial [Gammaproteobacteria bacterium]